MNRGSVSGANRVAPREGGFLEGFFLDIYTARAHNDGTVDQAIEDVLGFPHTAPERSCRPSTSSSVGVSRMAGARGGRPTSY
jgi:hypothetical protein